MLLESLSDNDTNIKRIASAVHMPPVRPDPQVHFNHIKQDPFYDSATEEWNELVSSRFLVVDFPRQSKTQFIGVLVEFEISSKATAEAAYEKLRHSPYYNIEQFIDPGLSVIESQLLKILVESKISPAKAKEAYEELKKGPHYNPTEKVWNDIVESQPQGQLWERLAITQFLGILIEAEFSMVAAQELLANLKNTPLYNKESKTWNGSISSQGDTYPISLSMCHLFSVLIEALSDQQYATSLYENLKASPFYDPQKNLWYRWEFVAELDTPFSSDSQLLDILVQLKLNSLNSPAPLKLEQQLLPYIRSF